MTEYNRLGKPVQSPWDNDLVQFARLLCEINATQDDFRDDLLAEAMDLTIGEVDELFERAHRVWEAAKP